MSVRKVYSVLVDGTSVFSGSYASCKSVYFALDQTFRLLKIKSCISVSFAF